MLMTSWGTAQLPDGITDTRRRKTGDESIITIGHEECPNVVYLDRKPHDGVELKHVCCAASGIIMRQEIVIPYQIPGRDQLGKKRCFMLPCA